MNKIASFLLIFSIFLASEVFAQTVWLDALDLTTMQAGWGSPQPRKSVDGNTLSVAGQKFERGIGTHAVSTFLLNLEGKGKQFHAIVGVDDETGEKASIGFYVLGDKKVLWESGVMKKGDTAKVIDLDIQSVRLLGLLVDDAGDGIDYDHADWCDAKLELSENRPISEIVQTDFLLKKPYILTPKAPDQPRINGSRVFGVRPGNPFLYTIAATGKRPMTFSAQNLPDGLALDASSGRITGVMKQPWEYKVTLSARNDFGQAEREFRILVGDKICVTPPMGWNSWNCWACAVDDQKVRAAADAMVETGLINHGWTYINIDDCWEIKPDATEPQLQGEQRDKNGMINTNKKFPDMKALSDYVHSDGLKLGIYSSPGPLTCAGFTASYGHEESDAQQLALWGIDYLKYDWCSYDRIAKDRSLPELKKPYVVMRSALDKLQRDIVYSLCQYGWGKVWEWGAEVGGNCWRTTGDIADTWQSMSKIGFGQAGHEKYAGPGHWNDPDMLVVGLVGWGPQLHTTNLSPDEQYTHISLWSLLSAPLLIGCDLGKLDDFTLKSKVSRADTKGYVISFYNDSICFTGDVAGQRVRHVVNA
jgi:alpha-galactosidase